MKVGELESRVVDPSEVDLAFTQHLQSIALRAWTAGLHGKRSSHEITNAFDPNNYDMLLSAQAEYQRFAKHGRLAVVSAGLEAPIQGFAMAKNDISPYGYKPIDLGQRVIKHSLNFLNLHTMGHLGHYSTYAWVKHVAAEPNAPKGVGTMAILESLINFRFVQDSTVYIDLENEKSFNYFSMLGYVWDGSSKPVYRFGEHHKPTEQRRYTAPVPTVRTRAAELLAHLL